MFRINTSHPHSGFAGSGGVIARANGDLFIYYASCDTRMHVTTTMIHRIPDYVLNTPENGWTMNGCVRQRLARIRKNNRLTRDGVIDG